MKIAYIIFNKITWLDFLGLYDPISRLKALDHIPDLRWEICAFNSEIKDAFGLQIIPDKVKQPLNDYDVIIVPGGFGTRELKEDPRFMEWIKTASQVPLKISVCTGALILGAAGFLEGRKATTHFAEYESLKPYCGHVVSDRIVDEGDLITAGAVSSSIDLGLYLCEKWAGQDAALEIRERMDYHG